MLKLRSHPAVSVGGSAVDARRRRLTDSLTAAGTQQSPSWWRTAAPYMCMRFSAERGWRKLRSQWPIRAASRPLTPAGQSYPLTLWGSAGVDVTSFLLALLNTWQHSACSFHFLSLCPRPSVSQVTPRFSRWPPESRTNWISWLASGIAVKCLILSYRSLQQLISALNLFDFWRRLQHFQFPLVKVCSLWNTKKYGNFHQTRKTVFNLRVVQVLLK